MFTRVTIAILTSIASLLHTDAFAAVGRTGGQFAVSPSGSAQYSIPLWTPPGIRGVQPHLALGYDSQLSYGLMGPGWTLNGFSTVTRCNPTFAQDGTPAPITLTTADGLCLDGNRLRTTGTGTYQTEIANFSQVTASGTAGNGPSYFTVLGKDGLTYEYGNTTDSKILPTGSSTPYIWALDKVTDRSGNQMTFTYNQASGAYVPLSIQYTAPSGSTTFPYQVKFAYSTKTAADTISKFVAGSQIQQTEQLSTITVTSSGTTIREYKLTYTTSTATLRATLTSIQECGGSSGTDCLAATSVGYQSGTAGVSSPATASGSGATNGAVYSVDIDGDGKQDLVFAVTSGGNYQWWVQLATSTGYGAPMNTGAVTVGKTDFLLDDFDASGSTEILAPVSGIWYAYKWNGTTHQFTHTSTGISVVAGAFYSSVDVDGDGLPDLVDASQIGSGGPVTIGIELNTSNSSSITFAARIVNTRSYANTVSLVGLFGNNQLTNSSVRHFDFDGDGRQDLLMVASITSPRGGTTIGIDEWLSRGTSAPITGAALGANPSPTPTIVPVHWNDDGCTDLIVDSYIYLSPCNGNAPQFITLGASPSLALDWDGDGRTDALVNVGGTWEVYRSEGNTVAPLISTGIAAGSGTWTVTDKNGDGFHDLVYANSAASNSIYYGLHNGAGVPADLATSFKDGYGNSVSPTYVSIMQSNYLPDQYANPAYPYANYLVPLYVVSKATFSDPSTSGGTYYQTFLYSAAWVNLQGRGFSNFSQVQTFDSRTALYENVNYGFTFPYSGTVVGDGFGQAPWPPWPNKLVKQWDCTQDLITLDSTANNQRYFPICSSTSLSLYELGGSENLDLISTTITNYTFDNFGNATNVSTTVTDNDPGSPYLNDKWTTTTVNTITPDTNTWCLSLPTETTVTNSSTAPGGASITRTVAYNNPDYTNCRQTEKVIEPSSATYKVVEDYVYDTAFGNFGNLHSVTVTGVGMSPRVTTTNWTANGQFPLTIINALSQSITLGFDPNTGMKTSQTDLNYTTANPLKITWAYDNFARELSESRPDGTSTTFSYNSCATNGCVNGNNHMTVTKTVLNVGGTTQSVSNIYLDSLDRPLVTSSTMLSGAYDRREVQYDNLGNVHQQGAPCTFVSCVNYWSTNYYDGLNRLTKSQRRISATNSTLQTTMIQYAGRTTTVTDPQGKNTTKINLVTGSLGRTQDHTGYYINFKYDAFGSVLSVTDSLSNTLNTMTYDYGLRAFQRTSNDADLGPRSSTYDALGELTAYSDAKGQNFSVLYDALSRPKTRTEPDLTTNWTWGSTAASFNIGKLQSVTAASSVGTYSEGYGYDSKTRLSTEQITIPGDATYTYTSTYNTTTGLLDTLQYPVSTSAYQLKVQYAYQNGILQQISDVATGTHYWTANAINPRGQYTQETLGNSVVVSHALDAVTGWVSSIQAGVGGGAALQNNSYLFDEVGNLTQRQDNNQGLTENVYYDNLYRLDHTVGDTNTQLTYDTMGRLATWDAYGGVPPNSNDYATPQSGCTYYSNPQPHAVRRGIADPSQPNDYTSYCYDANGNMIAALVKWPATYSWTSYNQPNVLSGGGSSSKFFYDHNHQRYKQIASYSGSPETTYYVGGLLEKMINSNGTSYRHYVPAGNNTIVYTRLSTGTNPTYYLTKDHLGSTAVITDSNGTSLVKEQFSALGWNENSAAQQATMATVTRHEFTGHEGLDNAGLWMVNMNGRIYVPSGSMFLSPDPFISDPGNTQSYNRYSYVNNNPLTNIDPSGYFSLGDLLNPFSNSNPLNPFGNVGRKIAAFPFTSSFAALEFGKKQNDSLLRDNTWLQPIVQIAACYWGGPLACDASSAYLTRLNGGSIGQSLVAFVVTDASAAAYAEVGTGNWATDALATGAIGGTASSLTGGSFTRGFEFAAAGSLVQSGYEYYVQHAPDWGSGQSYPTPNVPCGDPLSNCYNFTDGGHIPEGDYYKNTFGFNRMLTGGAGDCWVQSGPCSRFFDQIPGLQAVSQLHDTWMNMLPSSFNFISMPFAAGLSYGALVGGSYYLVPMLNVGHH